MAGDWDLDLDASSIDDLLESDEVADLLQEAGESVAELAAEKAPKGSGEGAASIHAETERDDDGLHTDVSWDRGHFYMYFAETGTEHQPATPFLRPALDQAEI